MSKVDHILARLQVYDKEVLVLYECCLKAGPEARDQFWMMLEDVRSERAALQDMLIGQVKHKDLTHYKGVVLYLPTATGDRYRAHHWQSVTRQQLADRLSAKGCDLVYEVDQDTKHPLPSHLYVDEAESILNIELRDGVRVAAVVDVPSILTEAQGQPLPSSATNMLLPVQDLDSDPILLTEYEQQMYNPMLCMDWGRQYLIAKGDKGVQRFEFDVLADDDCQHSVDLTDDLTYFVHLAYSETHMAMAEQYHCINMENILMLASRAQQIRNLVDMNVCNSSPLRDPLTGKMKPFHLALMADAWQADAEEQAACRVKMTEHGIQPLLFSDMQQRGRLSKAGGSTTSGEGAGGMAAGALSVSKAIKHVELYDKQASEWAAQYLKTLEMKMSRDDK